jgi:thioredoxin-related protein
MIHWKSRALLAGLLVASATVFLTGAQPQPSISWETNLYGSWTRAVKEDRPLVVYFMMGSCRYCEQLDREVFTSPSFAALAGRAIFVKVEEGKDDEHKNVAKMMKSLDVDRFPILVVLDAQKEQIEEVTRVVGYHATDKYVKAVADALGKWEKSRPAGAVPAQQTTEVKPIIDSNVTRASAPAVLGSCSLANVAVAEALKKMGYSCRTEDLPEGRGCNHILRVQQDGRAVSVYVSHIFGRTVWLGVPLVRVEPERATAPALLRVLEENWSIFPAQFNYDRNTRQLFLSKALDQEEVLTPERFQSELNHLLFLMKREQGLWSSLGAH